MIKIKSIEKECPETGHSVILFDDKGLTIWRWDNDTNDQKAALARGYVYWISEIELLSELQSGKQE